MHETTQSIDLERLQNVYGSFMQEDSVCERRSTSMTLLLVMVIPSLAAGLVLLASMLVQRVRGDW